MGSSRPLASALPATLPLQDRCDFNGASKGRVAAPPYLKIAADAGRVV